MALRCPSLAQRYDKTSQVSVNYIPICGGWIEYHAGLNGFRVLIIPLPWYKMEYYTKEIHLKVANKSPLAKRNFYFQSCYAVGCPGSVV
jgi:hypothetical protein